MNKKILFFSMLSVLSLVLIPWIIGLREFGDILSYTLIPTCFFVITQRINLKDFVYALALSIIAAFFFILSIDYYVNDTKYEPNALYFLICLYGASMLFGLLDLKKPKK